MVYLFSYMRRLADLPSRFSKAEVSMHEEIMKLVPTFQQLISEFVSEPDQLKSFFTLVSTIMRITHEVFTNT